jgi:acetylornithine deacetylase
MSLPPAIRYLRDYVAIPSVNPMRRTDLDPAITGERRYAEHLREQLRRLGLDAVLVGDPARPSVIAEARVAGARETIAVASHLDTVPVDGMTIDPFDPRAEGGRVFGRGTCDTKGGMAALVAALERALRDGTLQKNVIAIGEADEEAGSEGANAVLAHLGDRRPDWAIATEPTGLRVVTAHKGIVRARVVARGVAVHSSDPARGRNAIVALARAALAIDALGRALADRPDPRLGPPTLSIGLFDGGSAANIVPDSASLVVDRRLAPGESEASVRAELEDAIRRSGAEGVSIDWCRTEKPGLSIADAHPSVRACQRALAASALPTEPAIAAFGTDAGVFAAAGLPSVVLGPGSVEQAHTADEWVEASQVEGMVEILGRLFSEP